MMYSNIGLSLRETVPLIYHVFQGVTIQSPRDGVPLRERFWFLRQGALAGGAAPGLDTSRAGTGVG